ncbi:MAG: amidohydrolase, partial [Dehalococcoidia bacterium]
MDRYMMISADCHAGLPTERYRPYLDARYRSTFDERLASLKADRQRRLRERIGGDLFAREFTQRFAGEAAVAEGGIDGVWEPELRIQALETDGVVGEIIFPDGQNDNAAPFAASGGPGAEEPELQLAGARAYN